MSSISLLAIFRPTAIKARSFELARFLRTRRPSPSDDLRRFSLERRQVSRMPLPSALWTPSEECHSSIANSGAPVVSPHMWDALSKRPSFKGDPALVPLLRTSECSSSSTLPKQLSFRCNPSPTPEPPSAFQRMLSMANISLLTEISSLPGPRHLHGHCESPPPTLELDSVVCEGRKQPLRLLGRHAPDFRRKIRVFGSTCVSFVICTLFIICIFILHSLYLCCGQFTTCVC